MLGSKHSYTHTAALLRLIIGRILLFVCADEREINSNAGSARAPFLWLIWFDLLITFVSFVFPRNFSSVGKRQFVSHEWENSSKGASRSRGGRWLTWNVDVRWCRRFLPFTPPPSTCKRAGLGGFFFPSFLPFLLIAFVSPVWIVGSPAASFACQIKSNPLQSIQLSWWRWIKPFSVVLMGYLL